jgi:hypothetical protein
MNLPNIWFLDPMELIDVDKLTDFYPKNSMTFNEKLNSFMRFSIYFSIGVFLLNNNSKVFYSIFFGGIFTVILYNYKTEIFNTTAEPFKEDYRIEKCTTPKVNNPFMNVLVSDYSDNPERQEACDVDNVKTKHEMEKHFNNDLFRSVDEVFDNKYSYRQFYTTPNTTIPNDQEGFAKWLYFTEGKTLKEEYL